MQPSRFTSTTAAALLVALLAATGSPVRAEHGSGTGATVFGTIVGGLVVVDWATAHLSVRHYNEALLSQFPLQPPRRSAPAVRFGQVTFTRDALIKPSAWGRNTLGTASPFSIHRYAAEARAHAERRKSPVTATLLSIGLTLVPAAVGYPLAAGDSAETVGGLLIGAGVVFGPSVGHWYAGRKVRPWVTAGLRLILGFLALNSAFQAS